MEKLEVIILEGDDLNYIVEIDGNRINMKHSECEIWNDSTKGKKIGKLVDTGNNIKIKTDKLKLKLNYHEFVELFTLMKLKVKFDNQLSDELHIITKNDKL